MSDTDNAPDKMKVAELRAALQERGLDTKGTKPVLVGRLQSALDAEKPPEEEPATVETPEETSEEVKTEEKMESEESTSEVKSEAEKVETPIKEDKEEIKKEEVKEDGKGTKRKLDDEPFEVKENEPEIPDKLVCLDWHNSDLNLRITEDFMSGIPFSRDGWGYCYAGARATCGFTSGKIWYEVKYLDNMEVKVEKEPTTFDLRVGWSTNCSTLMLGEDNLSWCYSSAEGKMAHMRTFEEYGEKFEKGDVIGAFIDFTQEEINVTFTKNGEDQGDAFQISKADVDNKALFPHIMARNVKFEVNFGVDKESADKEKWKDALDGDYVKVGAVDEVSRVRGSPRIASRDQCEMIMMIGLPASGKTTWVDKHVADHTDKQYNVISTTTMINKMTVNGEPRKKHHKGKWEQVVQKATRSLQEMLRAASQRRRNVIIDQTNVYPNAQKRKARPFEGFQRRSVVVVPTDEVYKERCQAQEAGGCKDIPDEAIMEMKANFTLPELETDTVVPIFVETTFVELDRETAKDVVDLYNKIAKEKGYGKKHEERKTKKFRGNQRGNFRARGAGPFVARGNRPMRGAFRGNMRGGPGGPFVRGNMRGNMNMRGNGGPWMRGRGGMGPRGGMMGGPGMGPSPWSQGGNMSGGGMGPQGWGPWNQGGGMGGGNMGGGMAGNMGGMGNNMGGGMGNMGMSQGMGNNMGGNMRGTMGSVMGGGMGGMGGNMNSNSWSAGGGMGQQRQGNMGMGSGMGGGNMAVNKWGGNQGNNFGGNQGGQGGFRQGYPGSQKWGGNQRGNRGMSGGTRGRKF